MICSWAPPSITLVAGLERIDKDNDYDFRRDRSSNYAIDIFNPVYNQYARPLAPHDRYQTDATIDSVCAQGLVQREAHWRILAGLRHSRYQQRDRALNRDTDTSLSKSGTTPRLGVLYRIDDANALFASYGRSFALQRYSYTMLRPGAPRSAMVSARYKF